MSTRGFNAGLEVLTDLRPITNKAQFYSLYKKGLTGNRPNIWTYKEYLQSSYDGDIMVRLLKPGSPFCKGDLSRKQALHYIEELFAKGLVEENEISISELAPDHLLTLQGEVIRTEKYIHLLYNDIPGFRMREALSNRPNHAQGVVALSLLKHNMDANSYDWLNILFNTYPNAVIEFTCYSRSVGLLGWNTNFWEIREY